MQQIPIRARRNTQIFFILSYVWFKYVNASYTKALSGVVFKSTSSIFTMNPSRQRSSLKVRQSISSPESSFISSRTAQSYLINFWATYFQLIRLIVRSVSILRQSFAFDFYCLLTASPYNLFTNSLLPVKLFLLDFFLD